MQYIAPIGSKSNRESELLNRVAVTKESYKVYFYVDIGKNVNDARFSVDDATFTAEAAHGLAKNDYIKINDEIMFVEYVATNLITVKRGQRGTTQALHATASDIYKEQDHLSSTEFEDVTTGNVVPESLVVLDVKDARFYDMVLEAKVVIAQDSSAEPVVLYYSFSGYGDIDLTGTDQADLVLVNVDGDLTVTPPDGTPTTLYFQEAIVRPTGRYLYMWTTSHTDIVGGDTYNLYITLSVV